MIATTTIRQAHAADAVTIAELEQACALTPRSETTIRAELAAPAHAYFLAEIAGEPVGCLGVGVLAGDGHIMTVGVLPSYRGGGIAYVLVDAALVWLSGRGVHDVTLEVGRSNTAARALYAAHGFTPEGARPQYYADGDDAIIMWKRGG